MKTPKKYKDIMIDKQRELLEKAIERHGSQTELAKFLKYPRQQINMYLRGDNEMRYSTFLYFQDKLLSYDLK